MGICALLHPKVGQGALQDFRAVSPELTVTSDLAQADDVKAALIFGGDGTVHRYLPELSRRQIPALVVPVGSGNDFAKALRISSERVALQAWQQFCASGRNVRAIDLGLIRSAGQEILFCCVAGLGLDGDSNARANRMPAWVRSHGGYVLAALQSIVAGTARQMRVRTSAVESDTRSWLVAVGNAHRYGGGARIVPEADLTDGLLDICVVRKMSKLKLLCALPSVFWGGHTRLREVSYFRSEKIRVEADPELEIYADGEPVCRTPASFSVVRQGLNVIIPV